jgi:ubiquinone/menaquinone biosynthesis C-methylase UbiE
MIGKPEEDAPMFETRVAETAGNLAGEASVADYDILQRDRRDRGWLGTTELIESGIVSGIALEVGPGPGYLGLEWLKRTEQTTLQGVDVNLEMLRMAERNAREYGFGVRARFVLGAAERLPFADQEFDAVFSSASLHEWADPVRAFDEIHRVLKKGGRLFVIDLRRDMPPASRRFLERFTRPPSLRPSFIESVQAAYTRAELAELVAGTRWRDAVVAETKILLTVSGVRSA